MLDIRPARRRGRRSGAGGASACTGGAPRAEKLLENITEVSGALEILDADARPGAPRIPPAPRVPAWKTGATLLLLGSPKGFPYILRIASTGAGRAAGSDAGVTELIVIPSLPRLG
jgi:hypothetical protein